MAEEVTTVATENLQDFCETFSTDVHFAASKGRNTYTINEVTPVEGGFNVEIASEQTQITGTSTFTASEIEQVQKFFEEDEAKELEGNCFCTIESQPEHALQELKFLAQGQGIRAVPSRDEITEKVAQAFANLEDPNFSSDLTGGDIWRYFVSLFDLEIFENDPVATTWVANLTQRVSQISQGFLIYFIVI